MDKKEQTLARGYLVKSPVKSKDKAGFSKFWKLRWCVLVQILHLDVNEFVEDSRIVLNYYKDEDSYKKDEQYKGQMNISQCQSMKSCHNSCAGFDHVFMLEFDDGKVVRLSAPTCEQKFRWLMVLYKHRFNSNIESIVSKFGWPGGTQPKQGSIRKQSSSSQIVTCFEELNVRNSNERFCGRSGSQKSRNNGSTKRYSRDSGMFSPIDSLSIDESCDEPPPLPPRRLSGTDERRIIKTGSFSNDADHSKSPDDSSIDMNILQIFNDLFTFCSKCQTDSMRKESFSREKRRSKIWENRPANVEEVRRDSFGRQTKFQDGDSISQHSSASEDSLPADPFDPYSKIDENWLKEVKEKLQDEEKNMPDKEGFQKAEEVHVVNDTEKIVENVDSSVIETCKNQENDKEEGPKTENNSQGEADVDEEELYMDMSQCQNEASQKNEVQGDSAESAEQAVQTNSVSEDALNANVDDDKELKVFFEMPL